MSHVSHIVFLHRAPKYRQRRRVEGIIQKWREGSQFGGRSESTNPATAARIPGSKLVDEFFDKRVEDQFLGVR